MKDEGRQAAQARMLEAIKEIKSDTKRFDELKAKLKGKTTDAERAEILVDFIVDNDSLARSLPTRQSPDEAMAITTVTVTTVLIFASSAY